MDTVHDSQAFIHHHLNLLERPSTPGETTPIAMETHHTGCALNTLPPPSLQAKSLRPWNSPCCPCPPRRSRPFPKRAPPCRPSTAANTATTTITTTTSTRRRRRNTSTSTNTSTSMKARTRRRTGTGTTLTPSATARPAAGRYARRLCLTDTCFCQQHEPVFTGPPDRTPPGGQLQLRQLLSSDSAAAKSKTKKMFLLLWENFTRHFVVFV